MVERTELSAYLDELLQPSEFSDYCPNGLQVEGRDRIETLISGVTASQALIEAAQEQDADALLVHHGYFWRNEDARVTGMKARRASHSAGFGHQPVRLPSCRWTRMRSSETTSSWRNAWIWMSPVFWSPAPRRLEGSDG